jgi:hypothetical protein
MSLGQSQSSFNPRASDRKQILISISCITLLSSCVQPEVGTRDSAYLTKDKGILIRKVDAASFTNSIKHYKLSPGFHTLEVGYDRYPIRSMSDQGLSFQAVLGHTYKIWAQLEEVQKAFLYIGSPRKWHAKITDLSDGTLVASGTNLMRNFDQSKSTSSIRAELVPVLQNPELQIFNNSSTPVVLSLEGLQTLEIKISPFETARQELDAGEYTYTVSAFGLAPTRNPTPDPTFGSCTFQKHFRYTWTLTVQAKPELYPPKRILTLPP